MEKHAAFDRQGEYPCPCRRQGRLKPIALMEVLGCDRCQQIFSVCGDDGWIERASGSPYGYRHRWRWDGQSWVLLRRWPRYRIWPVVLWLMGLLCTIGIPLMLQAFLGVAASPWVAIAIAMAALPAVVLWMTDRR